MLTGLHGCGSRNGPGRVRVREEKIERDRSESSASSTKIVSHQQCQGPVNGMVGTGEMLCSTWQGGEGGVK
jgi:hypothetical protein